MKNLNSATGPHGQAQSASSNLFSIVNFLSLFLMLGLWLHTPLVKGQFEPPSWPENGPGGGAVDVFNSGNEYIAFDNAPLMVGVMDGQDPHINLDYAWSSIMLSNALGWDQSTGTQVVAELEDPDVSGTVNEHTRSEARFIAVYRGFDVVTMRWYIFYEVWEFDGGTFTQVIPPTALSTPDISVSSPNVDVTRGDTTNSRAGAAVIVYHNRGRNYIQGTRDLFNNATVLAELDVANATLIDGGSCPHFGGESWVDVSLSDFSVMATNASISIHIAQKNAHGIVVKSTDDWNTVFNIIRNPGGVLVCNTHFVTDLLIDDGSQSIDLGRPRISSNGGWEDPATSGGAMDRRFFAVTHTRYQASNQNQILLSVADGSTIFNQDIVNAYTSTDLCWNDDPAVSYSFCFDQIMVSWTFYDCNYCIPSNSNCDPSSPPNIQSKPGYYILAKQYDYLGNRIFGSPISVVNDPSWAMPSAHHSSIAGKEMNYTAANTHPSVHFLWADYNHVHSIYKDPEIPTLFLRPGKEDAMSNSDLNEEARGIKVLNIPAIKEGNLQIQVSGNYENLQVQIMDISGKFVGIPKLLSNENMGINEYQLNLTGLNSGMYLLKTMSKNSTETIKFIIQ